ncbi:hypothetical protein O181_021050 [Austropuccinia psidii MF-1]|uniref:Uncharacterized protein n=1 Tax=Austropuccinia psidii MF-1 TaxID=1389203 RepID=A0A9Q3CEZ4_9BASI|nr:hypothetical protein [Austropuccinia psidii MF-1]
MEHGQQEVHPSITLGRTWNKLPEDMSHRDSLQRSYANQQRIESQQVVQSPGGEGNQDKGESSHYPSYRRPLIQRKPTLIPSRSQGVDHLNSPVASHHSGTRGSVAKSHHPSQSQEVYRRRQGYNRKNKTSFSHRKKESDPIIQKLLQLVKEVHKSQK